MESPETPAERVRDLFDVLDADKDGVLTRAEMVGGALELYTSTSEAARLFDSLDINRDGVLDREEFAALLVQRSSGATTTATVATPELGALPTGLASLLEGEAAATYEDDTARYLVSLEQLTTAKGSLAQTRQQYPPVPDNYSLRRKLYTALSPLDQGDFRWEMLVPWIPAEKKLADKEKVIIFVTFSVLALTGQQVLEPEASIGGHLSYVAQFFSYAIGNPIGFRIIAMAGSFFEIAGDVLEPGLLRGMDIESDAGIPVLYNLLFLPINGYYVFRWALNRESLALSEEEEALYLLCFAPLGFSRGQFTRLLTSATFHAVPTTAEGGSSRTLCEQGEPLKDIFVPMSGDVDIIVGGIVAAKIPEYQIIGEASLLENLQSVDGSYHLPARSTVVAEPGALYVSWPHIALFKLQSLDPEIAYTIQLMIARTLSVKLREARRTTQRLVAERDSYGAAAEQSDAAQKSPEEQKKSDEQQALAAAARKAAGVGF